MDGNFTEQFCGMLWQNGLVHGVQVLVLSEWGVLVPVMALVFLSKTLNNASSFGWNVEPKMSWSHSGDKHILDMPNVFFQKHNLIDYDLLLGQSVVLCVPDTKSLKALHSPPAEHMLKFKKNIDVDFN